MKFTKIIEGFIYGELSPLMAGQVSAKAYAQSAKELSNMLPDPRGSVTSRPGITTVHTMAAEACKLFSLQATSKVSYLIALSNLWATIIPNNISRHEHNYVANGLFYQDSLSWQSNVVGAAEVEFVPRKVILRPGTVSGETAEIHQAFQIPDPSAEYQFSMLGLFRGPTEDQAIEITIGTTPGGDEILSAKEYSDSILGTVSIGPPNASTLYLTIKALDWSLAPSTDTESYIELVQLFKIAPASSLTVSKIPSPYIDAQLKEVKAVRVPNENKLFLLHKDVAPQQIYTTDFNTWTLEDVTFIGAPASWVPGSYPTTVAFYQSRSVWGGMSGDQETFVMSKTADYYDLTQGSNADDGLSFTLDREGQISWILGSKTLLLGTINGEYKISAEAGVIMPEDIQIELQSAHGGGEITPSMVGTETVFVSADSQSVRAMSYFWEDDGWVAENLSFGSEHITYAGLLELTPAINPDPILWGVLRDGTVVGCSYQFQHKGSKDNRVTGWHRHRACFPIVSLTVVEDFGHSTPFVAMKTEIQGQSQIHIGYFDFGVEWPMYLDDAVQQIYNTPTTTIENLEHLEGLEVEVLADRATHARKTVVGGQIELDEPAQWVEVGLGFTARLVTQPAVMETRDGVFRNQLGRWSEAFVYILDSALPLIDGIRAEEFEANTRMGYRQNLVTGYTNSVQTGWARDTVLTIEQDLPLPLTVSHITGELEK